MGGLFFTPLAIGEAVDHLFDEVDEEESQTADELGQWHHSVQALFGHSIVNVRKEVDERRGHEDAASEAQEARKNVPHLLRCFHAQDG